MQRTAWAVAAGVLVGAFAWAADVPTEATITDAEGKSVKVAGVKFGAGTRRLGWLADPKGSTDDAKKGPLALEIREANSTTYAKGILTLVPVSAIESIKYDYEKQVATFGVKGLPDPLTGTLRFKGLNALAFSGGVDGKTTTFSGGAFAKGNVKGVTFPDAKPLTVKKLANPWAVQIDQPKGDNPTLTVGSLKFLHVFPGGVEVLTDATATRKGDALKLDGVTSVTTLAVDLNTQFAIVEVQAGGTDKLVVLPLQVEKDGKKGTLAGFVGEAEVGYKLFPLHTIKTMKRVE